MSAILNRDEFLKLSPEEQATTVAKRVPTFATLDKAKQQEYLAALRRDLVTPGAVGGPRVELSASTFLKEGITRRAPDILATAASAAVPGSGVVPFLSRLGAAEVGQDFGDVATGQKITPGYGAATQLVGEAATKPFATLASVPAFRAFSRRTATAIADYIKRLVPAFRDYSSDAKGLYGIVHQDGARELSSTFERGLRAIKSQIPDTAIVQVEKTIEVAGRAEIVTEPRNARLLIDELPNLRKAGGKPYYAALHALQRDLPTGVAPELDTLRADYRHGIGFITFGRKGKFLHGETYDAAKAMGEALDKHGQELYGRGMDDLAALIRGPGREPIKAVTRSPWVNRLEGALLGGAAGAPLGIPHAVGGAAGGVALGEGLPRTTYRNVPLTTAGRAAQRLAPVTLSEAARELLREGNVPERLPGIPTRRGESTPVTLEPSPRAGERRLP